MGRKTPVTIYFKSGNVLQFEVDEIKVTSDQAGNTVGLDWSGAHPGVRNILLAQIEAVVW